MKKILFTAVLFIYLVSCSEDEHKPLIDDKSVPPQISNIEVENLAGSARITYTLPVSENLQYIKANYTVAGNKREVIGSSKVNSLLLEGFNTTDEYDVAIYSVSKSSVESQPVYTKVRPLTPPIENVYKSLDVFETFGGVAVKFENIDKSSIAIEVLVQEDKEWRSLDTHYTKQETGAFKVRGMDNVPTEFGVCIRDRWSNRSDTLEINLTPLYEKELDITKFKDRRFPGEVLDLNAKWVLSYLWDNDMSTIFQAKMTDYPFWFTIDLGVKAKLSRFKVFQRQAKFIYAFYNPHEWELWGSNDPDIGWENWTNLGHFLMVKPSGLLPIAEGNNNDEDQAVATLGDEFEFELDIPAVRYIRWFHIDSWSTIGNKTGSCAFAELRFFGSEEE